MTEKNTIRGDANNSDSRRKKILAHTKESISSDREGKNERRNGNERRRNTIWETETG